MATDWTKASHIWAELLFLAKCHSAGVMVVPFGIFAASTIVSFIRPLAARVLADGSSDGILNTTALMSQLTTAEYRLKKYEKMCINLFTTDNDTRDLMINLSVCLYIAFAVFVIIQWIDLLSFVEVYTKIGGTKPLPTPKLTAERLEVVDHNVCLMVKIDGKFYPVVIQPNLLAQYTTTSTLLSRSLALPTPAKEMAQSGSSFLKDKIPSGLVELRLGNDKHLGWGVRINDHLFTARHVLVEAAKAPEPLYIVVHADNNEFKTYPAKGLKIWKDSFDLDMTALTVPKAVWAMLGVKGLKPGQIQAGSTLTLYGQNSLNHTVSARGMALGIESLMIFRHGATTNPGWSGTGVFDASNKVVGIHTGHNNKHNLATSVSAFIELAKETPWLEDRYYHNLGEATDEEWATFKEKGLAAVHEYDGNITVYLAGGSRFTVRNGATFVPKGADWSDMTDEGLYDPVEEDAEDEFVQGNIQPGDEQLMPGGALGGARLKKIARRVKETPEPVEEESKSVTFDLKVKSPVQTDSASLGTSNMMKTPVTLQQVKISSKSEEQSVVKTANTKQPSVAKITKSKQPASTPKLTNTTGPPVVQVPKGTPSSTSSAESITKSKLRRQRRSKNLLTKSLHSIQKENSLAFSDLPPGWTPTRVSDLIQLLSKPVSNAPAKV
jgi:predicted RNA-binding protein with PUA-like domain